MGYSQAVEDYVKTIYKLQHHGSPVLTTVLAARMGVTAPSATNMVKKLAALNLVEYEPYRGVRLTELGERVAVEVIRHHRLMELYLAEALGLGWEEVDQEAERLEHVLSEELERRLETHLGNPKEDPHGDPIPSADLVLKEVLLPTLWQVGTCRVRVRRVSDRDVDVLRSLGEWGVRIGAELTVEAVDELGEVCYVVFSGHRLAMDRRAAQAVYVERVE